MIAVRTKAAASRPTRSTSIFSRSEHLRARGTGLGLATVHRIVTDYNGTIRSSQQSDPGHHDARAPAGSGSEVARRRRACSDAERDQYDDAVNRASPRHPVRRAAKPRILVVDDEPSMRDMLRIVLRRDGYDVVVAENGREAQPVLERERVDLLLSDIRMADLSGVDVLRAARRDEPRHHRVQDDRLRLDRDGRRSLCGWGRWTISPSRSAWTSCGSGAAVLEARA